MADLRRLLITLITTMGLAGCQLPPLSGSAPASDLGRPAGRFAITGKVEWPTEFEAQATLNDVVSAATVSLIDGISNATIATGLTDAGGNFTINPNAAFNPFEGDVFILEAVKGLGNNLPGQSMARLRTLVQRTKDGYDDVDARIGIVITLKTTTVAYVQSRYNLPPADMIGYVTEAGEYQEKVFYNYPYREANQLLTAAHLNTYHDKVIAKALAENRDPMGTIYGHWSVQTLAGNGIQGWHDGSGDQAMFHTMVDLKLMLEGAKQTLLVLDSNNRTVRAITFDDNDVDRGRTTVRTILNPLFRSTHLDATSSVDPVTGQVQGAGVLGSLRGVAALDSFSGGEIVLTDPTSHTIRIAYPDKRAAGVRSANGYNLVTVAGVVDGPGSTDGPGVLVNDAASSSVASMARFRAPWGVAVERAANGRKKPITEARIFVADRENNTVRMLVPRPETNLFDQHDPAGSALPVYDVYTIAGDPSKGAEAPSDQQEFRYVNHDDASQARFNKLNQIEYAMPEPLINGGRPVLYFTETATHVVRRLQLKAGGNPTLATDWGVETYAGGRGGHRLAQPDASSSIPLLQTFGNQSGARGGSRLGTDTDAEPGALFTIPTSLASSNSHLYVSTQARIFTSPFKNSANTAARGPLEQDGAWSIVGKATNTRGYIDGSTAVAELQAYPLLATAPSSKWIYFADRGNYRIRRYQGAL